MVGVVRLSIHRNPPGLISAEACWSIIDVAGYLYVAPTLWGVIRLAARECKHDRHLAG